MNDSSYSLQKDDDGGTLSNGPYSPVMVEERTFNRVSRAKRSRIFTIIIVLLLVTCAVLIVLYTMERGKRRQEEKTIKEGKSFSPSEVCTSEHCVRTAAEILNNLNQDLDPCEDFYSFACGGWQMEHPLPESKYYWTQVNRLKERNDRTLKRLLESKEVRDKYSKSITIGKVYDYYDACTNINAIENAGITFLNSTIAKYGSWTLTNSGFQGRWNSYQYLASIHRDLDISPLFIIKVGPDIKNSSINQIMIEQTRHAITRQSYLAMNDTIMAAKTVSAYKDLMVAMVRILGGNMKSLPQIDEIILFEKELSKISLPKEETVNEVKLYKLLTIKELTDLSNSQLDWLQILNDVFKDVGITFKSDDSIVVLGVDYFRKLGELLKKTPTSVIRNYIMWQVVVNLAPDLGAITQPAFHRFKEITKGSTGVMSIWEKCIDEISASTIGDPLGLIFVDEKFREDSLVEISKLISDQREAFIANLNELDWMDEQTKEKAKEKAKAIRQNIGYPKFIKDLEELDRRYKELHVTNTSYFTNMLNLRRFMVYKQLSSLKEPVDKNRWIIEPQRVNAFYDRVTNKITFPAGFLQPPFFDKNFPRAVSYGGIGIVVAHEITHGFDSNGRKFDKNGDHTNWWTNSSNAAFIRKSQCFIEQYSKVKAYGMNLNGVQTLGENIADNGAIKQAFMAYKRWVKIHGEEPRLPGMRYTNDQLFFISAGQIDCGNIRPQSARSAIEQGTHTLSHFRVNLEMSNSKEFAKVFKCSANSPMNPAKKCEVW